MRALIVLALVIGASLVAGQSPAPSRTPGTPDSDYRAGYAAAESDASRGIVRYIAIGGPLPRDWPELVRQAKELYQVELVGTGCVATPYERGYSESVIRRLTQKYGHDPVLALHKELAKKDAGE
jgi:hypothetical protein